MADQQKSTWQKTSEEFSSKGPIKTLWDAFDTNRKELSGFKRYLYLGVIFFGFILVWKGGFALVESIPILQNPVVSLVLGVLILRFTGNVFNKLM